MEFTFWAGVRGVQGSLELAESSKGEAMDGEGEDEREGPIVHVGGPHSSSSVLPAP